MMSGSLNLFSDCKREFSFHGIADKNEQKFIVCRKILFRSKAPLEKGNSICKTGKDITRESVKQRLPAMWQFLYPPFPGAEDCTG